MVTSPYDDVFDKYVAYTGLSLQSKFKIQGTGRNQKGPETNNHIIHKETGTFYVVYFVMFC